MARMPRLYVDGCAQHIIARGNNRSACFFDVADYAVYLRRLQEASASNQVKIHAFILMTNHVHLLASGEDRESIPRMMQSLGRRFVRYINTTYQRTGTLWEGRYKSSLISTTQHLLAISRYIEMNPVRAGMVVSPGHYPWSSYRHNGMGINISLISEHEVYRDLATTRAGRIKAYRNLFEAELPAELIDDIRISTNKGWVIGNDEFRLEIATALGRNVERVNWGGDRRSHSFKHPKDQVI